MKMKMLTVLAVVVEYASQVFRRAISYEPQHAGEGVAEGTSGYEGTHRRDLVQQWTDRVYRHSGAIHRGAWYDEPTSALITIPSMDKWGWE